MWAGEGQGRLGQLWEHLLCPACRASVPCPGLRLSLHFWPDLCDTLLRCTLDIVWVVISVQSATCPSYRPERLGMAARGHRHTERTRSGRPDFLGQTYPKRAGSICEGCAGPDMSCRGSCDRPPLEAPGRISTMCARSRPYVHNPPRKRLGPRGGACSRISIRVTHTTPMITQTIPR